MAKRLREPSVSMSEELKNQSLKNEYIQGGPEKNGMAYFPQYVDGITGISV